jgi:hypothetical protein
MANKFALTAQMVLTPPKNLGQVASQIQNQFKGINANFDIKADPQKMAQVTSDLKSIALESKNSKREFAALTDVIGAGARRFAAITVVTSTLIGLTRSIKKSLGDAVEFEKRLTTLSQVTGKTVGQLSDLRLEIDRISKSFGVSSDGLLNTAITLSQAGFTARQVKDSLDVLAKSELSASFGDIRNTTEGAIAILSQFRREAQRAGGEVKFLEQSLGAINDVSKAYAVESDDLITAIRQTGGSFEAAGGSLNELLGVFTSVRATTRESAETIATGLRTIFTRIQRVDTINALKQLGIELQDVEGKFVGPFEAIQRISKGLQSIDTRDIRFASIVEELGGFRQIGKVIPLIKQSALGVNALSTALRANDSLTKDTAIAQESLANKISVVKEEFQSLIRNFQKSDSFASMTDLGLKLAKSFLAIADSLEKVLPLLLMFATSRLGKGFAENSLTALGAFGKKLTFRNEGGTIPGSGNSDTVPAMLTPGEFVMRKSAVQSIGVNKLSQMNKTGQTGNDVQYFADGGEVSFSPKRNKFGGFFLNPFGGTGTTIDTDSKGLLLDPKKRSVRAILERFEGLSTKFTPTQDEENVQSNPIGVLSSLPYVKGGKKKNGVFTSETYKDVYPFVNEAAKEFKKENPDVSIVNDTSDKTRYYKGIIYENAVRLAKASGVQPPLDNQNATSVKYDGKEFALSKEAVAIKSHFDARVINALAGEVKSTKQKTVEPSVISGIEVDNEKYRNSTPIRIIAQKKVPALFPSGEGVKEGYQEDVKRSVTNGVEGMIESFSKNIVGDIGPFNLDKTKIRASSLALLKDQSAIGSISGYIFEGVISALTGAKAEGQGATFDFLTKDKTSVFTKLFQNVPKEMEAADAKATKESGQNILTQKIPAFLATLGKENMSNYLDDISYFNTGGLARGTDTVPAMLTPGEFVINRSAAQSIGYDTLAQMNNGNMTVGGEGGQYLASGGVVRNGVTYLSKGNDNRGVLAPFVQPGTRGAVGKFTSFASDLITQVKQSLNSSTDEFAEVVVGWLGKSLKNMPREFSEAPVLDSIDKTNRGTIDSSIMGYAINKGSNSNDAYALIKKDLDSVTTSTKTVDRAMNVFQKTLTKTKDESVAHSKAIEYAQRQEEKAVKSRLSKYISSDGKMPQDSPVLTPEEKAQNAVISAQNTANADAKINNFTQAMGTLAFKLGFLSSIISNVAVQYGGLSDAMAETITRMSTTFTAVFGIGQSLVEVFRGLMVSTVATTASQNIETIANTQAAASEEVKTAANLKSVATSSSGLSAASNMSKATLGLTGVVVGVSAGMAIAQYYATKYSQAQEAANTKIKEFTKTLENDGTGNSGELAKLQKDALENEAKSNASSRGGLYGAIGGGSVLALAGAAIGTAVLPVVGTAVGAGIGSAIGGAIGGTGGGYLGSKIGASNASISDTSIKAIDNSSQAQVSSTKAIYDFQKSIEMAELANLGSSDKLFKINASTESFVKTYEEAENKFIKAQELRNLDSLTRGAPLTKEQKAQKLADETVLQNLKEQSRKVEEAQRKSIAETSENLINRGTSKDKLFETLRPSLEAFKKSINQNRPPAEARQIFNAFTKGIKESVEANDKLRASQELINQAYRAQREFILSVNAGLKSLSRISDIEGGIETSLTNLMSSIDGGAASFKLSISSGFADVTKIPDMESFTKDVNNIVGLIGPKSQKIADSILNSSSIFERAESVLLNKNLAQLEGDIGEGVFEDSVKNVADDIFKDIGIDPLQLGELGTIIKENLKRAIIDKKGGGYIDKTTIREILSPLIEQGQDSASLFSGLIEQQQRKINQYGQLVDKLNELSKNEISIRQGIISSQERLFANISAVDPNITPEQKQVQNKAFRDSQAGVVSSRFGVKNPNNIGAILSKVLGNKEKIAQMRKEADLATTNALRVQDLNKAITDLSGQTLDATNRLKELSDQSNSAADILSKLDKIRAGKDQVKNKADAFMFGTDDERVDIQRSFDYLNQAMKQGNLAGFDDDQRKAIGSLLSDLGDTKIGKNGEDGNQIRSMLSVNEAVRQGADRGSAQAVFGKGLISSEKAIIQELSALAKSEMAASNALLIINEANTTAIELNTAAIQEQTRLMPGFVGLKLDGAYFKGGGEGVVGGRGIKISRPNGDDRLVTMEKNEFVITGRGREFAGDDFLHSINQGVIPDEMPGFANGSPWDHKSRQRKAPWVIERERKEKEEERILSIFPKQQEMERIAEENRKAKEQKELQLFNKKIEQERQYAEYKKQEDEKNLKNQEVYSEFGPTGRAGINSGSPTDSIEMQMPTQVAMATPTVKSRDRDYNIPKNINSNVSSRGVTPIKNTTPMIKTSTVEPKMFNSIGKKGTGQNNGRKTLTGADERRRARTSLGGMMGVGSPRFEKQQEAARAKAQKVEEYKAQQVIRAGGKETFNPDTNKFTTTNKRGDFMGTRDATPQQVQQRAAAAQQVAQNGAQGANGQQPVINFAEGAKTLQDALNVAINRIPEMFAETNKSLTNFVTALEGISKMFNGMKMEHTVHIYGAVSLTGMNLEGVSEAITTSVSNSIKGMVGTMIDEKLNKFKSA